MISKEILAKFKNLYQTKFNISLTDEEVTMMANDLVNLMKILLQPEPQEKTKDLVEEERRQDATISIQIS